MFFFFFLYFDFSLSRLILTTVGTLQQRSLVRRRTRACWNEKARLIPTAYDNTTRLATRSRPSLASSTLHPRTSFAQCYKGSAHVRVEETFASTYCTYVYSSDRRHIDSQSEKANNLNKLAACPEWIVGDQSAHRTSRRARSLAHAMHAAEASYRGSMLAPDQHSPGCVCVSVKMSARGTLS